MLASKPLEKHYMIEALRQTADGAAILKDWLGEGGVPVSHELAERRAMTCVCCPNNSFPLWWEKMVKNPIARVMRKHIEAKNQVGLKVTLEDDLHICRSCGCALKLKVHVPLSHIKAHTKEFPDRPFTPFCWIKNEQEAP